MPTNSDRADWAQTAVDAFQAETRTDDDDAIGDLLCDLCHLISRNGWDPERMLQSALAMFRTEEEEDSPGPAASENAPKGTLTNSEPGP